MSLEQQRVLTPGAGSPGLRTDAVRAMVRVRWAGVAFALVQIVTFYAPYPPGAEAIAFTLTLGMAVANLVLWVVARRGGDSPFLPIASLALDVVVLAGFTFVYTFDPDTSIWAILYILPLEGALLYGKRGALLVMTVAAVLYSVREVVGASVYGSQLLPFSITFRMGIGFIIAAVAGATASRLVAEKDRVGRGEQDLARTNQRLETVMANLPGMAYRCHNDDRWTMEYASEGAVDLTGVTTSDLIAGDRVAYGDLIHPDDRARVWEEVQEAIAESRPFQLEYRIVCADGSTKWVWEQGRTVVDEDGEVRLEGLIIDATERKRLEHDLAQSQKMEAVGRLAGGIAHDFNNLLAVVTSYADLLMDDIAKGTQARDDLIAIRDAGRRGAGLVRQLLAFSRQQWAPPEVLEMREVVVSMMRLLERAVGEHIQITTSLEEKDEILLDRGQLEQVLMNLVVNARDAMPRGGKLHISTMSVRAVDRNSSDSLEEHWVVLSVADTGKGIPPLARDHIFEPFFTTKPLGAGTGLGLATIYGIVDRAGGWIDVTSDPDAGTRFDVYFPVTAARSVGAMPEGDIAPRDAKASSILVVEDEAPVRQVVERILRKQGHDVVAASSAVEALALLEKRPQVDLLITDVVMPGLSGNSMVQVLRQRGFDVEVIYMSGYDEKMVSEQGAFSEDDVLLRKPFGADELLELVSARLTKT